MKYIVTVTEIDDNEHTREVGSMTLKELEDWLGFNNGRMSSVSAYATWHAPDGNTYTADNPRLIWHPHDSIWNLVGTAAVNLPYHGPPLTWSPPPKASKRKEQQP